jgi:hypothetical protein
MAVELRPGESKSIAPEFGVSGARVTAYGFLVAGVAATVTGGVFTGLSLYEQGVALDIQDRAAVRPVQDRDRREQVAALADRDLYRNVAIGSYVGGAAATLVGVLLFTLDDPGPGALSESAPTRAPSDAPKDTPFDASFGPTASPDGFGLSVSGRF